MNLPKLNKRLTLLREKKGWTKAETARRLGLKAPSTYGNWEYGIREPDLERLTQIAALYDVSVDYLLGENSIPSYKLSDEAVSKDIKYRMDKICEDIENEEGLTFSGEVITDLSAQYLIDSLRFSMEQAEKFNALK